MKIIYKLALSIFLLMGFHAKTVAIQMNGTYTINPGLGASATNFRDFSSAITYLKGSGIRPDGGISNIAPFGLSGPVVFMVSPGTFTGQITINGDSIQGLTPINRLSFEGAASSPSILIQNSTKKAAVILFNCRYVSFRKFTIIGADSCTGIAIVGTTTGKGGSGCIISHCNINISSTNYGPTASNFGYGILLTGDTLGVNQMPMAADSISIDSNAISALTGVKINGANSASYNRNIKFKADTIACVWAALNLLGIYNGIDVERNYLYNLGSVSATNGILLQLKNCMNSGPFNHRIIENKMVSAGACLEINFYGSISNPNIKTLIYNNMLSGKTIGININTDSCLYEIYHNSVSMVNPNLSGSSGIFGLVYQNLAGRMKCRNNIFSVNGGTPMSVSTPLSIATNSLDLDTLFINNNVYYNATLPNRLVLRGGFVYGIDFNTHSAGGDSSYKAMPEFVSFDNLHLADNWCGIKGTNLNTILPNDLDGTLRPSFPEIGCFESTTLQLNLRVVGISNILPLQNGTYNLGIRVSNGGTNTIYSFTAGYKLDGASIITENWNGNLLTCDTTTVYFTGIKQININDSSYFLKVFTYIPNGASDNYPKNDTLGILMGMIGTYTIGSSPSNFTTFGSAYDELNKRGLRGPVTLLFKPGTYSGPIALDGILINGLSPVNRLTLDGNRVATINSTGVDVSAISTIHAKYVTICNFNITSYGFGVSILSDNYGYAVSAKEGTGCTVKNCTITLSGQNSVGIRVMGNIAFALTYADSVFIDSNTVTNGYAGITVAGVNNSHSFNKRFKIRGNTINNIKQWGIYVGICNAIDILNNTINLGPANVSNTLIGGQATAGIFLGGNILPGPEVIRVVGNKISCRTNMGIYFYECWAPLVDYPHFIANNSIVNATNTGIRLEGAFIAVVENHYVVYHNTIRMDTAASYGLFVRNIQAPMTCNTQNNIFAVTTPIGFTLPVHFDRSPGGTNMVNNNLYYNASGSGLIFRGSLFNASNYKTALAGGSDSYTGNPGFISLSNLRLNNGCFYRGTNLSTIVPVDIHNITRPSIPTLGAYEFVRGFNDVGITALLAPSIPSVLGLQNVSVRINNIGSNRIDSCRVSYRFNSGPVVSQKWYGTMNMCDTSLVTFSGSQQINVGMGNNLKIYTSEPNGALDTLRSNDSLILNFGIPMRGTYTIGGTAPNYVSFNAAVTDLNLRGIDSTVTFLVRDGIYSEQFVLNGNNIFGVNAINRLVFQAQSGNRDSVRITFNAALNNNYVIKLTGMSYVKFLNLSIIPTNGTYSRGIEFAGISSFDTIENCKFALIPGSITHSAGIYAYLLTGGNHVFKNNLIVSGNYGIYWLGASATSHTNGIVVEGNTFQNTFSNDIAILYTSNFRINNNTFIKTNGTGGPHFSINCSDLGGTMEITRNRVNKTSGGSGILIGNAIGPQDKSCHIANNIVSISGTGNTANYGMYLANAKNFRVFHNSISIPGNSSSSVAAYFTQDTSTEIKNNIFANTGIGASVYLHGPFQMDYNLLYSTGTTLIQTFGTPSLYSDLDAWRAYSGNNRNSLVYRPAFTSATNLIPNPADTAVWAINGRGIHLDSASFSIDMRDSMRPLTPTNGVPDVGAYEVNPTSIPPLCKAVPSFINSNQSTDTIQSFTFGSDLVARIKWPAFSTIPTSVKIRQYSGVKPPNIDTASRYMYLYTKLDIQNIGTTFYSLDLLYKDPWIGTIPNKNDIRIISKPNFGPWALVPSNFYSPTQNTISGAFISDTLLIVTGADINNPLPVKIIYFVANKDENNAKLHWQTAMEKNNKGFEIQRSSNGYNFNPIGFVNGIKQSNRIQSYSFKDEGVFGSNNHIFYYRLKQIDLDGTFNYSNTVSVSNQEIVNQFSVYPNPFSENINLAFAGSQNQTLDVGVEISNAQGMCIDTRQIQFNANKDGGIQSLQLDQLLPGLYVIKLSWDNQVCILKFIKQ